MSLARQIVDFAIKAGSSDIHLEEGSPIAIRVNSDIRILENILKEDITIYRNMRRIMGIGRYLKVSNAFIYHEVISLYVVI